jgi:hypothetical protein
MMHIQVFDAELFEEGGHGDWMNAVSRWSWTLHRYDVHLYEVTLSIHWFVSSMLCFCVFNFFPSSPLSLFISYFLPLLLVLRMSWNVILLH